MTEGMSGFVPDPASDSVVTLVFGPAGDPLLPVRVTVCTAEGEARTRYLAAEDAALIRRVAMDERVSLAGLRRERRWTQEEFCRVFERTSRVFGPPLSISVRQLRRWESADPPRPLPPYVRVLEAMFGIPVAVLGFPPPLYHLPSEPNRRGRG